MGASIPNPGGNGGKRSLDAEINLVPFIDLLCSLIAFLLMTAVWMQVSSLELKQGSKDDNVTPPEQEQSLLQVFINEKGFTIIPPNNPEIPIVCLSETCTKSRVEPGQNGKPHTVVDSYYDYVQLTAKLQEEKDKLVEQKQISLILSDSVPYNDMIRTMDTCLALGLDDIALSGTML